MNEFCMKKLIQFIIQKGYIPKMFNPYNITEIVDYAPSLTTQCGSTTSSSTVLIFEENNE